MNDLRTAEAPEQRVEATCRHHWVIEQPNGPTSIGQCKHCGETREFSNNPDNVLITQETRPSTTTT